MAVAWPCSHMTSSKWTNHFDRPSGSGWCRTRTLRTPKKWRARRTSSSRASMTRSVAEWIGWLGVFVPVMVGDCWLNGWWMVGVLVNGWWMVTASYCNDWRMESLAHEWFGDWLGSSVFLNSRMVSWRDFGEDAASSSWTGVVSMDSYPTTNRHMNHHPHFISLMAIIIWFNTMGLII